MHAYTFNIASDFFAARQQQLRSSWKLPEAARRLYPHGFAIFLLKDKTRAMPSGCRLLAAWKDARDARVLERSGKVRSYSLSASGQIRFLKRKPFTTLDAWDDWHPWEDAFERELGPPVRLVRYTDRRGDSGRTAMVTWTRPKRPLPQLRRTAVIYVHGNAYDLGSLHRPYRYRPYSWNPAPDLPDRRDLVQLLADAASCDVVAVEFPGYGPEQGTRRVSAEDTVRALQAVCEAVIAAGAHDHLVFYGYSIGAALAAATLKRMGVGRADPPSPAAPRVRALVMEGAFTSAFETTRTPVAQQRLLRAGGLRMLDNLSTLPKLGELPVAFIHCDADPLCPLAQTRKLFRAARNCVGVLVAEGRDHNDLPTHPRFASFLASALKRVHRQPRGRPEGA